MKMEPINLKEKKEGYIEGLQGRKEKEEKKEGREEWKSTPEVQRGCETSWGGGREARLRCWNRVWIAS